ncbi:hypothetical protein [Dactylosporangium sp. NPDC048998]|uniref:hypothetical protein n=1 Tax=Dactylosporangium sp. NPDC048998 TaxID=3363976 RepID=UPI00371003F1
MNPVAIPPTVHAAARRFPLLGRPRPACPALTDRVTEVVDTAEAAAQQAGNGMAEAAHALNKAALIASDCGLPDLARRWCWQHINVYRRLDTLTALQAGYLLEPVLNLARLQIRAHHGQPTLDLLHAMFQAVATGTDLILDGHTLPLANLHGNPNEMRQLRQWTWLQHLSEGIRILALAGRWDDAVKHANALNGVGLHLMEGRQATVIAHLLHDNPDAAHAALEGSTVTQPWEHQVYACLAAMCAERALTAQHVTAIAEQFHSNESAPGYIVYRTRLGLTAATLISAYHEPTAQDILHQLITEALETPDGYAARDVLNHHTNLRIDQSQHEALTRVVTDAGLNARAIPEPAHTALSTAVSTAEHALTASIA